MPHSAAAQVVVTLAVAVAIVIELMQRTGASHAVAGHAHLHAVCRWCLGGSMIPVRCMPTVVSTNMNVDAALLAATACLAPLPINYTNKQYSTPICRTG